MCVCLLGSVAGRQWLVASSSSYSSCVHIPFPAHDMLLCIRKYFERLDTSDMHCIILDTSDLHCIILDTSDLHCIILDTSDLHCIILDTSDLHFC